MKEGEQLVMGLHGTPWNSVLPQGNRVQQNLHGPVNLVPSPVIHGGVGVVCTWLSGTQCRMLAEGSPLRGSWTQVSDPTLGYVPLTLKYAEQSRS